MRAYKLQTVIPANHRLSLVLPPELPSGAAEIIILTDTKTPAQAALTGRQRIADLRVWLKSLPAAPHLPLSVFDRGELYE